MNKTVSDHLGGTYRLLQVQEHQTVLAAAKRMAAENVGALLVTCDDAAVGIITERDLLRRVICARRDPASTPVSAVMTSAVSFVDLHTPLAECRRVMADQRVRHLPVKDERAQPVAMLSMRDLMQEQTERQRADIQNLEAYIYQYR